MFAIAFHSHICFSSDIPIGIMVFSRIKDIFREIRDEDIVKIDRNLVYRPQPVKDQTTSEEEEEDCFSCRVVTGSVFISCGTILVPMALSDYKRDMTPPDPKATDYKYRSRNVRFLRPKHELIASCICGAAFIALGIAQLRGVTMKDIKPVTDFLGLETLVESIKHRGPGF